MHRSRRIIAASISVSMALATSIAVAHADESSVLYVSNAASANCTDAGSGAGSAATPFCTIQAAADAVTAGGTVDIAAGDYKSAADITSSGTASAPIVFQATGGSVLTTALSFTGASYVELEGAVGTGFGENERFDIKGLSVNASSHITLDSIFATGPGEAVQVTGTSTDVTVTRSMLFGTKGAILVGPGGSGDVISTNQVVDGSQGAITLDGATDAAITSNTVWAGSNSNVGLITLTANSNGSSIENNIVYDTPMVSTSPAYGISVDSTSTAGTTEDYNVVSPITAVGSPTDIAPYLWAGVAYPSQAAFTAATGQGEHDSLHSPAFDPLPYTNVTTAPQINSANSAAPGMLGTDFFGYPCTRDPLVPVTGTGSPAYCARGAVQQAYTTTNTASAAPTGALSVDLRSQVSQTSVVENSPLSIRPLPTPTVSFVVDWGDGSTSAPVPGSATEDYTTTAHTYAKPGTYVITDTAESADGSAAVATTSVTTSGSMYTPFGPTRILDTRKGTGAPKAKVPAGRSITVKIAGADSIPANVTAVALNLTITDTTGTGYLSVGNTSTSNVNYRIGQTLANSLITPVTNGSITIFNTANTGSADIIADVSGYFQQGTGNGYSSTTLDRILNTRTGTGAVEAKVAANKGLPVTIAGIDSIPAGVKAVAVHITVADTTGTGWIAAEPDGAGIPATSSLNYGPGQIVSNTIIVPVASDGKIELYNGGGDTPVNLIADVSGYFSADAPDAYVPVTPIRAWDTRQIYGSTIAGGATEEAFLDGENGVEVSGGYPENAILAANTTVTNTKGGGYLTVYPAETSRPSTSNINFTVGQTLAGFGLLSTSGPYQEADVTNSSTGSLDVVFDISGYFANS